MFYFGILVYVWIEWGGGVYRKGFIGRGFGWWWKYILFFIYNFRKICWFEEYYDRYGLSLCNCYLLKLFNN